MKKIFFGSWDDASDMWESFQEKPQEDIDILFAAYGGAAYEGCCIVVYRKDGTLYEVNGSHCSCYGLEGQWSPEETFPNALEMKQLGCDEYENDAIEAFKSLCVELKKEYAPKRFLPEKGEKYWFISLAGEPLMDRWDNCDFEREMFNDYNVFATAEEARKINQMRRTMMKFYYDGSLGSLTAEDKELFKKS